MIGLCNGIRMDTFSWTNFGKETIMSDVMPDKRPVPKAVVNDDKDYSEITYIPGPQDLPRVKWHAIEFKAHVPVRVKNTDGYLVPLRQEAQTADGDVRQVKHVVESDLVDQLAHVADFPLSLACRQVKQVDLAFHRAIGVRRRRIEPTLDGAFERLVPLDVHRPHLHSAVEFAVLVDQRPLVPVALDGDLDARDPVRFRRRPRRFHGFGCLRFQFLPFMDIKPGVPVIARADLFADYGWDLGRRGRRKHGRRLIR